MGIKKGHRRLGLRVQPAGQLFFICLAARENKILRLSLIFNFFFALLRYKTTSSSMAFVYQEAGEYIGKWEKKEIGFFLHGVYYGRDERNGQKSQLSTNSLELG